MASELLSPTLMNDEEMLAKGEDEAKERTTAPYDSMDVEDESEVTELTDDDILFETDERD